MNADHAIACIDLAMRASHEVNNRLISAEQWVKESSEPGNHGHMITARVQVEDAQEHALRSLALCIEAATELRHLLASMGETK